MGRIYNPKRPRKRWIRTKAAMEAMEAHVVYLGVGPGEREPIERREFRRGLLVALRWALGQELDIPARVNEMPFRRSK